MKKSASRTKKNGVDLLKGRLLVKPVLLKDIWDVFTYFFDIIFNRDTAVAI